MPDVTTAPARAATGQATYDLFVIDDQLEHDGQGHGLHGKHLVQHLGLVHRSREPVEQEAFGRVVVGQPVLDHRDGDLVRDQVAGVHVLLRLDAEVGALADVGPEDVSRGDLGHGEVRGNELRLRAFPCPGRPDQHEAH